MTTPTKSLPPQSPEKKRDRSPNFPSMDLKTAIERARTIYKHETKNAARVAVIVKHWGYAEKSSGGKRALAALNAYGLLDFDGEGEKREGRLSAAALRIILGTPESTDDINKAALRPKIHKELWTKYGATGLPSDANLTNYLILEKDFNKDVVPGFIRQFRATMAFAKLTKADKMTPPPEAGLEGGEDDPMILDKDLNPPPPPPLRPGMKQESFSLEGGDLIVRWPAKLTADELKDVEDWLDILKRKIKRAALVEVE